jgi:hypothetical protein
MMCSAFGFLSSNLMMRFHWTLKDNNAFQGMSVSFAAHLLSMAPQLSPGQSSTILGSMWV